MLLDSVPRACRQSVKLLRPSLCAIHGLLFIVLGNPSAVAQQGPCPESKDSSGSFEVAAIKASNPDSGSHSVNTTSDRIAIENYTLTKLIMIAYGLKSRTQISGGPEWIDKQAFDISAKLDDAEVMKMQALKRSERQTERNHLVQSLLIDRFHLKLHRAQKIVPVYALLVGKSGAKLAPSDPSDEGHSLSENDGHMEAKSISMDALADDLTRMPESGDRVVLNRTGLSGRFNFEIDWAPDYGSGISDNALHPGLFTALLEQLGLKLESQKMPVEMVVVESAVKPDLD